VAPTLWRGEATVLNAFVKSTYSSESCATSDLVNAEVLKANLCGFVSPNYVMYDTTTVSTTSGGTMLTLKVYGSTDSTCSGTAASNPSTTDFDSCVAEGSNFVKYTHYVENDHAITMGVYSDWQCQSVTNIPKYMYTSADHDTCDKVYNFGMEYSSFKSTHTQPPHGIATVSFYLGSQGSTNLDCSGSAVNEMFLAGACTKVTDSTLVAALSAYGCTTNACYVKAFKNGALRDTSSAVSASLSMIAAAGVVLAVVANMK
jgi:hypothetical protein